MVKSNKNEVLQEKSKTILENIVCIQKYEKELKELDKKRKDLEKDEKEIISKRNDCMKKIECDTTWITKYSAKMTKNVSDENKPKRKVDSGMMRPKVIPLKCLDFIKKIVKDKSINEKFLTKEYEYTDPEDDTKVIKYKLENIKDTHLMPQQALSCLVNNYLKFNNLYAEDSKKLFKPDAMIINLLNIKDGEKITFEQFQRYAKRMYSDNIKEDSESEASDSEEVKKDKKKTKAPVLQSVN